MAASDIFGKPADIYARYRTTIQFVNLVVGGVPSDKSVIEGWIRSRMELGDQAIADLVETTHKERGGEPMTPGDAVTLVMESELAPSVNGFKRDADGQLCLEGRNIKAAIKEWSNSAFPGTKFPGKPADIRKGLMRYGAETVFVDEILVPLGVTEPTRVEERVKHVMTPQGPRSSINRVEVIDRPRCTFHVSVRKDFLPQDAWGAVWAVGERIGLGADRGRSDGQFTLEEWEKID